MPTTDASVAHATGIPVEVERDLLRRLSRIRGQVEGIHRMVEDGRYCPDILQQFVAVHSALRGAEKRLLESHLQGCATRAITQGGPAADSARREILEIFSRYLR